MKGFVAETLSTAVLNSGCTKNVCGQTWQPCYLETDDERNVKTKPSSTVFNFGNEQQMKSQNLMRIPSI